MEVSIEILNMKQESPTHPYDFRVDRDSPLGNCFRMKGEEGRDVCCGEYADYFPTLLQNKVAYSYFILLLNAYKKHGKLRLFCWCAPLRCHAETIRKELIHYYKGDHMEQGMSNVIEVIPAAPTQDMLAKARAALDVQGNPRFAQIMQGVVTASGAVRVLKVTDQAGYEVAGNMLIALKAASKELVEMKRGALAFPKLYEKSVRETMKPVENMLDEAITTVEAIVLGWAKQLEAAKMKF